METNFRVVLFNTLDILWRRRLLLSLPLLIILPMTVLAARFLPGGYHARALVMLQETVPSNPLARERQLQGREVMIDLLRGVRGLLFSDYVLGPVVTAQNPPGLDPKMHAHLVRKLARRLQVDLLGNGFLEFKLAGDKSAGLGLELQRILNSFIGALLRPPGESAGSFLQKGLKDQLTDVEKVKAGLERQLASILPSGVVAAKGELARLQGKRAALSRAITAEQDAKDKSRLEKTRDVFNDKINELTEKISSYEGIQSAVAQLSMRREALQKQSQLVGSESRRALSNWRSLLNAPERMIIVDPPKDPQNRTRSRLKFVLTGVLAGGLLGIALVAWAEVFDPSIRRADQLRSIPNVPFLGTLSALLDATADGTTEAKGRVKEGITS